jgi:hypothetical protein
MDVVDHRTMWALLVASIAAAGIAGVSLMASQPADAEGSCAAICRQAYNQCRIQTKGGKGCEGQFTSCMQGCRR